MEKELTLAALLDDTKPLAVGFEFVASNLRTNLAHVVRCQLVNNGN
ncbi:hypothetical protein QM012_000593 [Aureobasidium pullulans]|uniref:Uncharacterized protein n=1 Tax=Aureobasidium pullulans TaxID=5580 RepID=A0ABR0TXN2_AURPU